MTTREIVRDEIAVSERVANKVSGFAAGNHRLDAKDMVVSSLILLAGLGLIWFGLTNTGSFYTNAGKMGGMLGTIFYEYQAGTLMACVGTVLVYDNLKHWLKGFK